MIWLVAAVAYAVHRALRWAIRRDDEREQLMIEIARAELHGEILLALDRIERDEKHLLPKARREG